MIADDHYLQGARLAQQKRYPEAVDALRRALELQPDMLDALEILGVVYLEQEQFESAEEQFRAMLDIDAEATMAYVNLSRLYQRQGRIEEAEQMQSRAQVLTLKKR